MPFEAIELAPAMPRSLASGRPQEWCRETSLCINLSAEFVKLQQAHLQAAARDREQIEGADIDQEGPLQMRLPYKRSPRPSPALIPRRIGNSSAARADSCSPPRGHRVFPDPLLVVPCPRVPLCQILHRASDNAVLVCPGPRHSTTETTRRRIGEKITNSNDSMLIVGTDMTHCPRCRPAPRDTQRPCNTPRFHLVHRSQPARAANRRAASSDFYQQLPQKTSGCGADNFGGPQSRSH